MKALAVFLCALLCAVLGTTTDVQAQYPIKNNSAVTVYVCVHTSCGIFGPYVVTPITVVTAPVAMPPCVVNGISYSTVPGPCPAGPIYPVGFGDPTPAPIPPPNPPNFLQVTPWMATFW